MVEAQSASAEPVSPRLSDNVTPGVNTSTVFKTTDFFRSFLIVLALFKFVYALIIRTTPSSSPISVQRNFHANWPIRSLASSQLHLHRHPPFFPFSRFPPILCLLTTALSPRPTLLGWDVVFIVIVVIRAASHRARRDRSIDGAKHATANHT